MKKVRILGNVNHNNVDLELYHVYELEDEMADALVNVKAAKYEESEKVTTDPVESMTRGKNPGELVNVKAVDSKTKTAKKIV